mgnify:FL=1
MNSTTGFMRRKFGKLRWTLLVGTPIFLTLLLLLLLLLDSSLNLEQIHLKTEAGLSSPHSYPFCLFSGVRGLFSDFGVAGHEG